MPHVLLGFRQEIQYQIRKDGTTLGSLADLGIDSRLQPSTSDLSSSFGYQAILAGCFTNSKVISLEPNTSDTQGNSFPYYRETYISLLGFNASTSLLLDRISCCSPLWAFVVSNHFHAFKQYNVLIAITKTVLFCSITRPIHQVPRTRALKVAYLH